MSPPAITIPVKLVYDRNQQRIGIFFGHQDDGSGSAKRIKEALQAIMRAYLNPALQIAAGKTFNDKLAQQLENAIVVAVSTVPPEARRGFALRFQSNPALYSNDGTTTDIELSPYLYSGIHE